MMRSIYHGWGPNGRVLIDHTLDQIRAAAGAPGPTGSIVEPSVARTGAAPRELSAGRLPAAAEAAPRAIPSTDKRSWQAQPEPVTTPRPALQIEPLPGELASSPRQRRDPLAALADELSTPAPRNSATTVMRPARTEPRAEFPPEPHVEPRREPRIATPQPIAARPATTETAPKSDENLADLALRLEAALRKPIAAADARPSATPTRVAPPLEQVPPVESASTPSHVRTLRPSDPKSPRADTALYDSIEQEMASLLGRPVKH